MGGIGEFVKSAVGGLTGGLLAPKMPKAAEARQQFMDPNRGKRIAAARKAKMALGNQGRSSLKIDLSGGDDDGGQTRGGVTIG